MQPILLIPAAFAIGFVTAIPVGATQIEITKRSLRGYVSQATMIAVGSASSDIMYGLIAMFGIAPLLQDKKVMTLFWLLSSIMLIALGIFTLLPHARRKSRKESETVLASGRLSLLMGFTIAVTNAPIMLWWLIYAHLVERLGIVSAFSTGTAIIFVFSGGLGIASYLILLSFLMKRLGRSISKKTETIINISLGVLLILLSFYSVDKFLRLI